MDTRDNLLMKIELLILVFNDQQSVVDFSTGLFGLALLIDFRKQNSRSRHRLMQPMQCGRIGVDH